MPRGVRKLLPLIIALAFPASAAAIVQLPQPLGPIVGNPADKLADLPIEDSEYDQATRCTKKSRPGMAKFQQWLEDNAQGVSWGTYRCEKWGKNSASLHAENRALDWHLDASSRADRQEAERIITLLLAPDRLGNPMALARRMGVQEIIWDCGYWGAFGGTEFARYSPCVNKRGKWIKGVNATVAHRDHIHFGLSRDGALGRTSFWQR